MKLRVALLATSASFVTCTALAQSPLVTLSPPPSPGATPPGAAAPPGGTGKLEDIVVTARKRNEKLLQVPISITALSSKDIQERAVYSIADLASQTPGLTVDSTVGGGGRSDRSFPEYVIRGMVPSLTTNPTTTVFLDGAPLISGQIDNLEDLDRVEVLKGPQSAYFGRETFAGAISLVTKDPANVPTITLDLLAASPNYYDERVKLEGPIIPDKLWISGSYRYYSRQGSYDNEAVADKTSQHLGDQSTQSGNVEIVARPSEDLKVKLLGLYWRDSDGPSAQALIEPSQSNCLGFWFCGVVPDRLASQPATNDLVTPPIQRLLNYLGSPAAGQAFKPLNDSYGLTREAYHGSAAIDYNVEPFGFTVSSLTAIDNQRYSELQDLANDDGSAYPNFAYTLGLPYANKYGDFPFFVEQGYRSLSQEFRITSDSDQRFRYLFGVNYEWTRVDNSLGGGNGFDFFVGDSPQTSSTYSAFYGLGYDILPNLTLNFEGRVQSEKIATSSVDNSGKFSGTYTDFLPRVSLEYKFTPKLMAYATYSEGVNPGTFNGFIAADPEFVQQELAKLGARVEVQPEKLTNYEIGAKGSFLDDTLNVSADVYYDIWYRQIVIESLQYFVGNTLENTSADLNNGSTDLAGFEGEVNWEPVRGLTFNLAGAINESAIKSGPCALCAEEIGTTDVEHKQLPNTSKYQMTAGVGYTSDFSFLEGTALQSVSDWTYFGRADYTYKSGSYVESDDLVRTPDENLVNLRVGVSHGNLRIEGFVDNVTNWGGPTSLAGIVNLGSPAETYAHSEDALVAGLPYLRAYGVRLHYKFSVAPPAVTPAEPLMPQAAGAPPVAPVRTYLVFFDWDRADLTARARQIVAAAAEASTHVQTTRIEVNGYTDLSGTVAYNQKLSVRRAEAVELELEHDGVPKGEIAIHGYGESHPLIPTAAGVREPQNRRVEIILG